MADNLGITDIENLQIAALKKGATPEEASLSGKLPTITPVEDTGRKYEGVSSMLETPAIKGDTMSNIIANTGPGLSYDELRNKAVELSLLKTSIDPNVSPSDAFDESMSQLRTTSNTDAIFESYQQDYANRQKENIINLSMLKARSQEYTTEQASGLIDAANNIDQEYTGPAGLERIITERFADESFDEYHAENKAAENYAWAKWQQDHKSKSLLGKAWDFLGALAPDAIKDMSDLVDGNVFTSKKQVLSLVVNYRKLHPYAKIQAFDEIYDKLKIAYEGNDYKIASFISMLNSTEPKFDYNIHALEDAIDSTVIFDAIAGVSRIPRLIKTASVARNAVNKLAGMGAEKEAAYINTVKLAKEHPFLAAENVDPFKTSDYFHGAGSVDNIAKDSVYYDEARVLAETQQEIKDTILDPMSKVSDENFTVHISALSPLEKETAIAAYSKKLAKEAKKEKLAFESIGPGEITKDGFTFKYKLDGVEAEDLVTWKMNDVGVYESINNSKQASFIRNNPISSYALSNEAKLALLTEEETFKFTFGGMQATRVQKRLSKIAKDSHAGLNFKEHRAVDNLVQASDEAERVFTYRELKHEGVELKTGNRTYSEKEIKSYYKKLALNKELWRMRNHSIRKQLDFIGARSITYRIPGKEKFDAENFIGIPKETAQGLSLKEEELIFAPQLSETSYISTATMDVTKLGEKGFKPVELIEPQIVHGKKVSYAMIRDEGESGSAMISDLPYQLLDYRGDWYGARHYLPGYHYIKDEATGRTIAAAENKKAGIAWKNAEMERISKMTEEELTAKKYTKDSTLHILEDRELNTAEKIIADANIYGGLYTGSRKEENLLLITGKRPGRLSWGESTQRYINSLSNMMPLNEYRLAARERFINSVNAFAKKEGKKYGLDPRDNWKTTPILITENKLLKSALEEERDYLISRLNIKTKDERVWHRVNMQVAELMSGRKLGPLEFGNKLERLFSVAATKEPMKSTAGVTFQSLLGWFNPRNYIVQAQNATLAMSMFPEYAMQASTRAAFMQPLMMLPDDALETFISRIPGIEGGLAEDIRLFKRTGLYDSITRIPMLEAMKDGITPGSVSAFRRLAHAGMIPFEQGDLFSRIVSFNIAKKRWLKANSGKAIDDVNLEAIVDDTLRMHMNMQTENAAKYQLGFFRPATQFLQVQSKFVEKVLPALLFREPSRYGLTAAEGYKVLAGQLALYGFVGVAYGDEIVSYISRLLGYDSQVEFKKDHPDIFNTVQNGGLDTAFEAMGFHNQFGGDQTSILASLDDNVLTDIIGAAGQLITGGYGDDSAVRTLLGPTSSLVTRTGDAIIDSYNTLKAIFGVKDIESQTDNVMKFASDWAAITSHWSNTRKAWWLYNSGVLYSSNDIPLLNARNTKDVNLRTIIGKAWGFPLNDEANYYQVKEDLKEVNRYRSEAKQGYKEEVIYFIKSGNKSRFDAIAADWLSPFNVAERREIQKEILGEVLSQKRKSPLDREVEAYIKAMYKSGGRVGESSAVTDVIVKEK